LEGSSDIVDSIFAYKGGQYLYSGLKPVRRPSIMHDAGTKIVDAPLTLNFRR